MSHRPRHATSWILTGLLVAAAVGLTTSAVGANHAVLIGYGNSTTGPAKPSAASKGTFSISGGLTGLYPGDAAPLVLSVFNPNSAPITVTSITTTVGKASSACQAKNLSITPFQGSLTVGPGGSAQVSVTAAMAYSAPNACEGVVFPLQYAGVGQAG